MALITAIVLFLVGTLGTAISRLLTNESRAWTPRIIQLVIRRAIVRLHPAQRERFEEEWQGHVDEVPGEIGKLTVALGFLTAARRMTLAEKAEDAPLTMTREIPSETVVEYDFRCFCGTSIVTTEKTVTCTNCGKTFGIRRVRKHRPRWNIGPQGQSVLQLRDLKKLAIYATVGVLLLCWLYELACG